MSDKLVATACALLVGNELLNGTTEDCNLGILARTLRSIGVRLERALVLPDQLALLSEEIRKASLQFDVVFTSGGVGPTHDDVTIVAVAQAFGVTTEINEELRTTLIQHYGQPLSEGHTRLALVPQGCCMVKLPNTTWPTIVMRNVWVLPGVPAIFRTKLQAVRHFLRGPVKFHSCAVLCRSDELALKSLIDHVVESNPQVEIGSYPLWPPTEAQTKISFEGTDAQVLRLAVNQFVQGLPNHELIRIDETTPLAEKLE